MIPPRPYSPLRVLVIVGNPAKDSYCDALSEAYVVGARSAGANVRLTRLRELRFDPVLHEGYRKIQELEPDLKKAQSDILWAQHLVFVYPVWWGAVPALLKGFLDRTFHPGFAYAYHANDPFFEKLLTGRSGHLIATSDAPPEWIRLAYRNCDANMMKRAVLEFCGVSPVGLTRVGRMRGSTPAYRAKWTQRVRALGEQQGAPAAREAPAIGGL